MVLPPKTWEDEESPGEYEDESADASAPRPRKEWDDEEEEEVSKTVALGPKKKWDDEEEEEDVLDSWDAADDSEEERKKERKKAAAAERAAAEAAMGKKSALERVAEKKALNAAQRAVDEAARAALENETPAEKRARIQARELEADLAHAEDLFGAVGIGAGSGREQKKAAIVDPKDPTKAIDLATLDIFRPATKAQFDSLREVLVPLVGQNVKKAHYSGFLQELVKGFAKDMTSEQIRLVASKLTVVANEKQKEEKDALKGGKKKTAPKKAGLAAAGKVMDTFDTRSYEDAYDDYDDFM